ncbi:MAG TPA: hypothetical protein VGG69_04705 [Rhizomicrobium sp.]|jgi:hypothetical protein
MTFALINPRVPAVPGTLTTLHVTAMPAPGFAAFHAGFLPLDAGFAVVQPALAARKVPVLDPLCVMC